MGRWPANAQVFSHDIFFTSSLYSVNNTIYYNAISMFRSTMPSHKLMALGGVEVKEKKDINIEVGARIKRAREAAGLTQDRFAELIGMGTKNVSAIERGAVGVSLLSLQKICQILSISSDDILFERKPENAVQTLASRLGRLSAKRFAVAGDIFNKLLEAFALSDE